MTSDSPATSTSANSYTTTSSDLFFIVAKSSAASGIAVVTPTLTIVTACSLLVDDVIVLSHVPLFVNLVAGVVPADLSISLFSLVPPLSTLRFVITASALQLFASGFLASVRRRSVPFDVPRLRFTVTISFDVVIDLIMLVTHRLSTMVTAAATNTSSYAASSTTRRLTPGSKPTHLCFPVTSMFRLFSFDMKSGIGCSNNNVFFSKSLMTSSVIVLHLFGMG
jgi:hypothetical protein